MQRYKCSELSSERTSVSARGARARHGAPLRTLWALGMGASVLGVLVVLGGSALGQGNAPAAPPANSSGTVLWQERFGSPLDWRDPQDHGPEAIARVYSVGHESNLSFLRAVHDMTT